MKVYFDPATAAWTDPPARLEAQPSWYEKEN
jgi:hypothetical protein